MSECWKTSKVTGSHMRDTNCSRFDSDRKLRDKRIARVVLTSSGKARVKVRTGRAFVPSLNNKVPTSSYYEEFESYDLIIVSEVRIEERSLAVNISIKEAII